jgi:hypothetical protein
MSQRIPADSAKDDTTVLLLSLIDPCSGFWFINQLKETVDKERSNAPITTKFCADKVIEDLREI